MDNTSPVTAGGNFLGTAPEAARSPTILERVKHILAKVHQFLQSNSMMYTQDRFLSPQDWVPM